MTDLALMRKLPVPVDLCSRDLTPDGVSEIRKSLLEACDKWLSREVADMSSRIPLTVLKLRQYLRVPVPAHRKALTRLILSAHTLSIEILRYAERRRERAPRDFRFCRFCRLAVESESHALITCTTPTLTALRCQFFMDIYRLVPDLPRSWASADDFLWHLVQCRDFDLTQRLAKYTYDVFAVFATCPIFKPAEYLYITL
ncbi:hypothetical protein B0H16DRAFT_1740824 [Mycena metata]|uniref:Uncharacterized protein n=1 Tax=Mycena metata TaxID=1033252 RepID=A0AAD7MH09_9AGAR|nr:hypothetical protein B0H16DRAFT_1740824 [Mycena metata]